MSKPKIYIRELVSKMTDARIELEKLEDTLMSAAGRDERKKTEIIVQALDSVRNIFNKLKAPQ